MLISNLKKQIKKVKTQWIALMGFADYYQYQLTILGLVNRFSTSSNLCIEPLPFLKLEKDESLRTLENIEITCSVLTPCLMSYSICLQITARLPYFLWFLFSHPDAFSDRPLTYFTTVFSMCSTCHSLNGKLFCTNQKNLLFYYMATLYIIWQ